LEGSVAVSDENQSSNARGGAVVVGDNQVGSAVEVEIGDRKVGRHSQYSRLWRLKRSVAVSQENTQSTWSKSSGIPGKKDREIGLAIVVEVSIRESERVWNGGVIVDCRLEGAIALPKQNTDISTSGIGDSQIYLAVAIEVGRDDGVRRYPDWIAHRRGEISRPRTGSEEPKQQCRREYALSTVHF
jgi:hypothetical protein